MHVLVVEDDDLVMSGIRAGLELHGFTVDAVADAGAADAALATLHTDIVILDLGLPDDDGLDLLRRWRSRGVALPILILTAREAPEARVAGLNTGADDYVAKPFDLDELVARLHALLRRASGRAEATLSHGALRFLPSRREVYLGERRVELSRREMALLEKFLHAGDAVLTEDQLKDGLYGMEADIGSNALSVHLHHLRRKLGRNVVRTIRGVGYRLGPAREMGEGTGQ